MLEQDLMAMKHLITLITSEGLLLGVNGLVCLQVTGLLERLVTEGTLVWTLIRVHSQVCHQVLLLMKSLIAGGTGELWSTFRFLH